MEPVVPPYEAVVFRRVLLYGVLFLVVGSLLYAALLIIPAYTSGIARVENIGVFRRPNPYRVPFYTDYGTVSVSFLFVARLVFTVWPILLVLFSVLLLIGTVLFWQTLRSRERGMGISIVLLVWLILFQYYGVASTFEAWLQGLTE